MTKIPTTTHPKVTWKTGNLTPSPIEKGIVREKVYPTVHHRCKFDINKTWEGKQEIIVERKEMTSPKTRKYLPNISHPEFVRIPIVNLLFLLVFAFVVEHPASTSYWFDQHWRYLHSGQVTSNGIVKVGGGSLVFLDGLNVVDERGWFWPVWVRASE